MPGAPSLRVSRKASLIQSRSMTWWSEHSAVPRFVFAKSAIRCRFVDRFAGFRAPSRVFRSTVLYSWRLPSLRRVPASPVPRFHRLYEGATTSRPRNPAPLWLRLRAPRAPPLFVLAEALLTDVEDVRQAWNS